MEPYLLVFLYIFEVIFFQLVLLWQVNLSQLLKHSSMILKKFIFNNVGALLELNHFFDCLILFYLAFFVNFLIGFEYLIVLFLGFLIQVDGIEYFMLEMFVLIVLISLNQALYTNVLLTGLAVYWERIWWVCGAHFGLLRIIFLVKGKGLIFLLLIINIQDFISVWDKVFLDDGIEVLI